MTVQGELLLVKNNGAFNPEMRLVIISDEFPNDRTLDTPVDITGYTIKMDIASFTMVNEKVVIGTTFDSFITGTDITITDATGGYFKPLSADISAWTQQVAVADVVFTDVLGDGLNDTTRLFFLNIEDGVT